MGGALLPKMTWNVICSGLSPVTFIVNSLIMCASTSFKKSRVFVIRARGVLVLGGGENREGIQHDWLVNVKF